jgi:hypothetical protein
MAKIGDGKGSNIFCPDGHTKLKDGSVIEHPKQTLFKGQPVLKAGTSETLPNGTYELEGGLEMTVSSGVVGEIKPKEAK